MVVLGSGAFGRQVDHKGRALRNGIGTLTRRDMMSLASSLSTLCHVRTQREDSHQQTRKGALSRHWIFQLLDVKLPKPPELQEIIVCCLSHRVYGNLLQQLELTRTLGKHGN